jgi:hypothetical protein
MTICSVQFRRPFLELPVSTAQSKRKLQCVVKVLQMYDVNFIFN